MVKQYIRDLRNEFIPYGPARFSKDLMAGLTVTAVALPLALAFGVSCGADAGAGLITAIIAGILIGGLSGASYQISGPTGAMTAILVTLGSRYGLQGIFIAGMLSGIILILASVFKVGKLVSFIPGPVVTGFTSGIAVIIALGQIDNLFGTASEGENAIAKLTSYGSLGFSPNLFAILTGVMVVAIMLIWPKKWQKKFPSSLAGIIAALAVNAVFNMQVNVVGTIPKTLLPGNRLQLGSIDWAHISDYVGPAVSIAALGMIESLLCGASAGRMKGEKLNADRELLAQGIGNFVIPFFGGVPATAAIARTSVAIKSGGQTRLVSIIHSLGLLASMFLLGPSMSRIPLAALAGVLIVTAWRMNEWDAIREMFVKQHTAAIIQFLCTMLATVVFDLTIAILIGIAVSILLFTFHSFRGLGITVVHENNASVISLSGPLFFGTQGRLADTLENLRGVTSIHIDMKDVSYVDDSALLHIKETIHDLCKNNIPTFLDSPRESVSLQLKQHGFL